MEGSNRRGGGGGGDCEHIARFRHRTTGRGGGAAGLIGNAQKCRRRSTRCGGPEWGGFFRERATRPSERTYCLCWRFRSNARRGGDARAVVSVNAGDPGFLAWDLAAEYALAGRLIDPVRRGYGRLAANAVDGSFAPDALMAELHDAIHDWARRGN